jgi:hypothetical protein
MRFDYDGNCPFGGVVLAAGEPSENQFSTWSAGKVVCNHYGEAIMKTPWAGQHPRRRFLGLEAGAAALPAVSPLRSGWRFLPVFAVLVTNVIIAIVAWYAVGALLR